MKHKFKIIFLLILGVFLYLVNINTCILCDGNTDKIVNIDYETCNARFKKFGEDEILSLKLENIKANTSKECKCIFDSFTEGFGNRRVLIEHGFLIEKYNEGANIYVETINNKLILWNDVINLNKDKLCHNVDTWSFK